MTIIWNYFLCPTTNKPIRGMPGDDKVLCTCLTQNPSAPREATTDKFIHHHASFLKPVSQEEGDKFFAEQYRKDPEGSRKAGIDRMGTATDRLKAMSILELRMASKRVIVEVFLPIFKELVSKDPPAAGRFFAAVSIFAEMADRLGEVEKAENMAQDILNTALAATTDQSGPKN